MKTHLFLLASLVLLFQACTSDLCHNEMTYFKAVPIFGDLDDYRKPIENQAARSLVNPNKIFVTDDLLLISEKDEGLHIYDNSDPAYPKAINFVSIEKIADISIDDNYLYARSLYDILVLDISNPENVQLVKRNESVFPSFRIDGKVVLDYETKLVTETFDCETPSILSGQWVTTSSQGVQFSQNDVSVSFVGTAGAQSELEFGTLNRLVTTDDYLYFVDNAHLYTMSKNGGDVKLLQNWPVGNFVETIYPQDDQLFIGSRNAMQIYSIEDPSFPRLAQSFFHVNTCDPVLPHQDVAYVTLRSGGDCTGNDINQLLVAEISETNAWGSSSFLREINMSNPHGMAINNDRLYVAEGEFGMKVFDISVNTDPQLMRTDEGFTSFDLMNHPSNPFILLSAGPTGISQLEVIDGKPVVELSTINY